MRQIVPVDLFGNRIKPRPARGATVCAPGVQLVPHQNHPATPLMQSGQVIFRSWTTAISWGAHYQIRVVACRPAGMWTARTFRAKNTVRTRSYGRVAAHCRLTSCKDTPLFLTISQTNRRATAIEYVSLGMGLQKRRIGQAPARLTTARIRDKWALVPVRMTPRFDDSDPIWNAS